LASTLGGSLTHGLAAQGVPAGVAERAGSLPPVATLFASLLGYNPVQQLLGDSASSLSPDKLHYVTGRQFFPQLISGPFHHGLQVAFLFAVIACLVAAWASWLRGGKYHYVEGAELGTSASAASPEPVLVSADAAATDGVSGAGSMAPETTPGSERR
jgi:hypothetical protein